VIRQHISPVTKEVVVPSSNVYKTLQYYKCSMLQSYLVFTERLLLLQLSNIADLTCVVCGVQTSKITIIFYIKK